MLKLDRLSVKIGNFELQDISLEVGDGEYFVLLGESGIGKTILLETIAGLIKPAGGEIYLSGKDITYEKIQSRNIGVVYQDNTLFPNMSVRENVIYPLKCNHLCKKEIENKLNDIVEMLDITSLLHRKIYNLSGGELQKVSLARALIMQPALLLLDEPLSSVDAYFKEKIKSILRKVNKGGQTIFHITHDYFEAISLADRIGIMEDNRISQVGAPDEIFRNPRSHFVANFIGIKNFYRGRIVEKDPDDDTAEFRTGNLTFHILTDKGSPSEGFLILRREDVIISDQPIRSSARNNFYGEVIDVAPAKQGVEVTVDIGVRISALITEKSSKSLGIDYGRRVWVSFKATAAKFIGAEK